MRRWHPLSTGLTLAWILIGSLMCSRLHGQETRATAAEEEHDHIETDRDSFTRSPRIVPLGRTVAEGSYTFLDQDADYDGHLFPDLLLRYGTSEWLELRLGWTYEVGKFHQLLHEDAGRVDEGVVNYGAKLALTSASDWVPDSALIGTGYTPTSGESNDTDLSLEYAAGWRLPHGGEFDVGLRWFAQTEEEDHFTEWAPSVVLKSPLLHERWDVHAEYFTLLSVDRAEDYRQHYAGPGTHYLITRNLEIGVRVFWGMGEDSAAFICNSGLGIRF